MMQSPNVGPGGEDFGNRDNFNWELFDLIAKILDNTPRNEMRQQITKIKKDFRLTDGEFHKIYNIWYNGNL